MTPSWALVALAAPPVVAMAAWLGLRSRHPHPAVVVLLNAIVPGAGLAAAGRPGLEVGAGVLMTQVVLVAIGGAADLWMYLPIMAVGAVWGAWNGPLNPIERLSNALPDRSPEAAPASSSEEPEQSPGDEAGYPVAIRCTECGAEVELPVLHRMAHCAFCGSDHLVTGHDELLQLALPERVPDPAALREALLDHFRYARYVELYQRTVAPLERQAEAAGTAEGLPSPELAAAAAAAERAVTRQADAYRRLLGSRLEVRSPQRFFTPYFHGMGVLFQAAFGREPTTEEKVLRFVTGAREATAVATDRVALPRMARLSWLRALRPAATLPGEARCLPVSRPESTLDEAFGDPNRIHLLRDLRTIRVAGRLRPDVRAVVWRPWWVCEVRGAGHDERLLVDAASGSVAGPAPPLDLETLEPLPEVARAPGRSLRFVAMECPTCGFEFRFTPDAVLHFCSNCHRVFAVDGEAKREVVYAHDPQGVGPDTDLVPFWAFRLELRTGEGDVVTDLLHLKDGIDGSLDQLGEDHEPARHAILAPAVRCRSARLTGRALESLFAYVLRRPPRPAGGRFPLDVRPEPWPVGLDQDDARQIAPLLLASVFSQRDLAKVSVHQVSARLFEARLEGSARLVYAGVPRVVGEPYRAYVGLPTAAAVARATGR